MRTCRLVLLPAVAALAFLGLGCSSLARRPVAATSAHVMAPATGFQIVRNGARVDVVEIDASGGATWSSTFNGRHNDVANGYAIAPEREGGFVVARYHATAEGRVEMTIRRVDADGRMLWSHVHEVGIVDDAPTCLFLGAQGAFRPPTECPLPPIDLLASSR